MYFALALITATPITAPAALARAQGGDTIVFAPGVYGQLTIKGRVWRRPITLRLGEAVLNLVIRDSAGVILQGGSFVNSAGYGALVANSRHVSFDKASFTSSHRGIVIDRSQDVEVAHSKFIGLTSDGINIALSQRIKVTDNLCRGFITQPPAHPDCIQGWSRPGGITSDVLIARNVMQQGTSQGIFFGNHLRNGVDDGGFDRVTIIDNIVEGRDHPQGIALYDCRDCVISNNRVSTLPGGKYKMNLVVKGGSVRQSGNMLNGKAFVARVDASAKERGN